MCQYDVYLCERKAGDRPPHYGKSEQGAFLNYLKTGIRYCRCEVCSRGARLVKAQGGFAFSQINFDALNAFHFCQGICHSFDAVLTGHAVDFEF